MFMVQINGVAKLIFHGCLVVYSIQMHYLHALQVWCWAGMAYQLDLADNRLPIFDKSRLPIADILSVLSYTDTDNRYFIGSEFHQY